MDERLDAADSEISRSNVCTGGDRGGHTGRIRDKPLGEIERLEVFHGNRKLPLAEIFSVSGDPGDGRIDFEGDLAGVHFIGYGMTAGEIRVHGNAGRHVGGEMKGGLIVVEGNAGDWAGGEMHGGLIDVAGNAGHLDRRGLSGSKKGMTDGTILIGGDVGSEAGASMRRGTFALGVHAVTLPVSA